MLADRVEDDVVRLAVLREVLSGVVDDGVGTERPHEVDVFRVADRGDVRTGVSGELDGRRADSPRGAVDDDALPRPNVCDADARQGRQPAVADCRSFLERRARRHAREQGFAHADVFRLGAEPLREVRPDADDPVADLEPLDGRPYRCDLSRHLGAEDTLLRPKEAAEEALQERLRGANVAVGPVDGRRMDPDENLVVGRLRPLDLLDTKDLRGSVPVVDDRPHRAGHRVAADPLWLTVRTTLPVFCPVST